MTHDRMHRQAFNLSHEFLAIMLGVQRPTVSIAAAALQEAGLIRYTHGRVTVRNRKGLEAASCECYAASALISTDCDVRSCFPTVSYITVPLTALRSHHADDRSLANERSRPGRNRCRLVGQSKKFASRAGTLRSTSVIVRRKFRRLVTRPPGE